MFVCQFCERTHSSDDMVRHWVKYIDTGKTIPYYICPSCYEGETGYPYNANYHAISDEKLEKKFMSYYLYMNKHGCFNRVAKITRDIAERLNLSGVNLTLS